MQFFHFLIYASNSVSQASKTTLSGSAPYSSSHPEDPGIPQGSSFIFSLSSVLSLRDLYAHTLVTIYMLTSLPTPLPKSASLVLVPILMKSTTTYPKSEILVTQDSCCYSQSIPKPSQFFLNASQICLSQALLPVNRSIAGTLIISYLDY